MHEALTVGVERLLLDNFSITDLEKAVEMNEQSGDPVELEASGGIEENTLLQVARTGVDFISIGALTKNLRATDFSMRFRFA